MSLHSTFKRDLPSKEEIDVEWIPAVGGLVLYQGNVLLVLRANPPGKGEWAVPGGRVLPGETLEQAVEREVREETGIVVKATESILAFRIVDHDANGVVRSRYCVTDFVAEYISGEITARDDALDVMWASPDDVVRLAKQNLNEMTEVLLSVVSEFCDL